MKNLQLFIMSFIVLTVLSCSEENIQKNDETAIATTTITGNTKKLAVDDCGVAKEWKGSADTGYNCYGLAFYLSETGNKVFVADQNTINSNFIATHIFKEDNTSNATKVLYWNNETDFNARNFYAVDHAAIIVEGGNIVYSKEGSNNLYKNCIGYVYLAGQHYYQTYSLNIDLNKPATAPKRENVFTVSLQYDASFLGVEYSWEYDTSNLELISSTPISITLKVKAIAIPKNYTITLKAKHQKGVLADNTSYPKTITNSYTFILPPIASFTGSNYVTKTNMGAWTATVSDLTPPYTYSWWLKRHEDPSSFYLQVGTGTQLYLSTNTSVKSTYYDLYFRVIDANNKVFSTESQIIQSTGPLVTFDL